MNDVAIIINKLTPYKGRYKSIRKRQSIQDLMGDILDKHEKDEREANKIAKDFWKGSTRATAQYLFDFCKRNVVYKEENTDNQTVKTIGAILVEGRGDCKHYSQLIVGICCALHRLGYPIYAKYRFAIYDEKPNEKGVRSGHVFAVIMDRGQEIWCDPVLMNFNQRTPRYIKHTDKTPPMSNVGTIGQVWDVSGISNGTTVAGMHNNVTLGAHHRHRQDLFKRFMDSPLDPLHPGIPSAGVTSLYKSLFHHHKKHGAHSMSAGDRHMLAKLHHRFGQLEHAHHRAGTLHNLHNSVAAAPVMDPVLPPPATRMGAMNITRDERGTLYEMPVDGAMGWVDEIMGKAKHKPKKAHKAHHGLHIKIQPGKLLKKSGGAAPRNAFLLYLKMDLFHTASKIQKKILHNAAAKEKLHDWWRKIGGNTNKLDTALTQGLKVWNKHHAAHKISGYSYSEALGYIQETMGIAPVAIPAILAAAAPIIAKVKVLLKSFGIGEAAPTDKDIDDAHTETIDNHNKATKEDGDGNADIEEDGTVHHGGGVKTKVTKGADGKQTLEMSVDDPDDGDTDTHTKTKTKTKTTTEHEEETPDGDEEEVETKTKTKTVVKKDHDGGGGIMDFWEHTKDYVIEHKKWFIIGGVGIVSLFLVPKIYHAIAGNKPKRRK